ncbi:uncharacterized protein [Montipora foliosa]|uniref:uncharacterized protein n=1 Tax=Montipora foliosa TaxID=591990 RepID=UPI0035F1FAD5
MDLIDLIGDSRTESLPAGFLRSIKNKYKQESSRVFPAGTPYKSDIEGPKTSSKEGELQRSLSAASGVSVPSFMAWRVPSRLVQQNRAQLQAAGGYMYNEEREKLGSIMSAHSRRSNRSPQIQPVSREKDELPRLDSANSVKKSPAQRQATPPVQTPLPAVRNLTKQKSQDKNILKDLEEAKKLAINDKSIKKSVHPHSLEAVESWLKTATHKERELALKFFSTLSGVKTDKLEMLSQKLNNDHTEKSCEICDSGRIEEALQALARSNTVLSRSKLLSNPKRTPDITKQSFYQKARQRLPVHLRQQYQTWHHLPVYKVSSDAAINKSAMFTQTSRKYGRHFTIHPEWGLHKPIVL